MALTMAAIRRILVCLPTLCAGIALYSFPIIADPILVHSSPQPPEGRQTISLQEIWRAGDNEEVFFGEVAAVISDEQGWIYVLDGQQCQVQVFDPDGKHLRTLSREGDGPGEVRHPKDIFLTQDARLAIVQGYPSQLVFLRHDGTPAGQIKTAAPGLDGGGMRFLENATELGGALGGDMIVTGSDDRMVDGSREQVRFLSRFTPETVEVKRFYEHRRILRGHRERLIERDDYFPNGDLHCIGSDGRVFLAPKRNQYWIEVFTPDGEPQMTIEREFSSRNRDKFERERVWAGYQGHAGRHGSETQVDVEDTTPDIEALHVAANGCLWVQHSRSHIDQPDGVMLTYDVFGPDGRLLRQVSVECEGDARRDRLVPLPDGHWVRIAGAIDAYYVQMGGALNLDEEEDNRLEIVYYGVND